MFTKQSTVCEELARAILKEFNSTESSNFPANNEPILLILDRRVDPVTPILNQVRFYGLMEGGQMNFRLHLAFLSAMS